MQDLRVLNMSLLFDAHLLPTAWLLEIALRDQGSAEKG